MKRFVVPLFALFALILPLTANAAWVTKEIKWKISGVGPTGTSTGIWVRDTTYAPKAFQSNGFVDTTGSFTLDDARIFTRPSTGTTGLDTVWVAYLMVQQDTAVATPPTLSSVTLKIDGRVGGFGTAATLAQWVQADSVVCTFVNNTAGTYNYVLSCPIRAIFGLGDTGGNGPENKLNNFYRLLSYDALRIRVTSQTGTMQGSLRAFIRYWKGELD